jgi:hypothetical protein
VGHYLKSDRRTDDLSDFMILLGGRAMGLGMLPDLRRRGQSTNPPATAIIMLPIAQLIIVKVASEVDENAVVGKRGIALGIHGTAACSYVYILLRDALTC